MDRRHLLRDAGLLALTVTTLILFCFLVAVLLTVLVHFLQHQAQDDLAASWVAGSWSSSSSSSSA